MKHVSIIGGGIAGLSAAFYLQKKSEERGVPLHYTLFESSGRLGGKVMTERRDGFVIEGGPDSFITQKPWGLQLCRDLGIEDLLIPCNEAKQQVYLVKNGQLVLMPAGFRLAAPTEWRPFLRSPLMTLRGKLRVALDLVLPPRKETSDESIGDFLRRRFGQEALEAIGGPVMAGIHVADHDKLSLQATFPMFAQVEQKYGSVIRGLIKARKARAGQPPAPALFMSFAQGTQVLVEHLEQHLDGELRKEESITALRPHENGCDVVTGKGETIQSDAVILAAPSEVCAGLLAPHDEELARNIRAIRNVSTAVLSLGFRKSDLDGVRPLDGFGFVVPKTEQRSILACTWSSTKFPERAPDDAVLMRVFVGGDVQEAVAELPDVELRKTILDDLADLMQIRAEPVVERLFRWPKGNPQYDVGHLNRVAQLEQRAAAIRGLYLAGSAYRGIGIPDCVESAIRSVERLLDEAGPENPG